MVDNTDPSHEQINRLSKADVIERVSRAAFGKPLITNVLRGQVAEAIVSFALEPEWSWCSADYSSWDFEHGSGLRLEVKQSAARQSWTQDDSPATKCSFDIAARQGRWEGLGWVAEPGRAAHIYVFAHHRIADPTADHGEPDQWDFYVVPAARLPDTKRISLAGLTALATPAGVEHLAAAVAAAAAEIQSR